MTDITKGQWVMIISQLPIETPPPYMSIFFAIPYPMDIQSELKTIKNNKIERVRRALWKFYGYEREAVNEMSNEEVLKLNENLEINLDLIDGIYYDDFQLDTNRRLGALQIRYEGQQIRVFPEEYSVIKKEHMPIYTSFCIFHEVLSDFSDFWKKPKNPDERFIYEAALIDGCNDFQANNVLSGKNADEVDDLPPPNGWYEVPKKYCEYFGE